jgi:DNA-binding transcriptional MerR regulator
MTTGDVAREARIPQQTLISWDRAGVLKARRPGRRSSKRAPRFYDEDALAAALFARHATEMGFKGEALKQMIGLVQRGDRKALEAAAIVTFRTGPGLMAHYFTPVLEAYKVQVEDWIKFLRDSDRLIEEPTSLWTIREHFLQQARNLISMGERSIAERLIKGIQ